MDNELDSPYEHALTRLATLSLGEDLDGIPGETTRLSSLAVSQSGIEPGPVHQFEPRHWFWAMFYEPRIRIALERGPGSMIPAAEPRIRELYEEYLQGRLAFEELMAIAEQRLSRFAPSTLGRKWTRIGSGAETSAAFRIIE